MHLKLPVLLLIGAIAVVSCSRKKDKFLNRNFHAMTAYYNIIYNGNLALEQGKKDVESSYQENYWNILPIERMAISETQSSSKNSNFETAEEKATKSIQKHSMFMGGKEYNPQIDEAFLLLGKARYYDQRFVPSKDAFNFILNHYPKSSTINEAEIWLQKTNLRLEYYGMVIENLVSLINTSELLSTELYEASATLAQAYIYENQEKLAIVPINSAIETAPNDEKKGRLLFIKAQLYASLGEKDSAIASFDEVIALNRKSPRRYMIHSKLEQLRLQDLDEASWHETEMTYEELSENRENRPFLDFIFYDNAVFRLAKDSVELATLKFNESLRQNPQDKYLKSRNYFNLGEIYFDKASYETAGKYYDSTLTNLGQASLEYRRVKRKRDNLKDVIKYERIANETDSVLNLVNASEAKRIQIFNTYIEKLKKEEESVFASKSASSIQNSRFGSQRSKIGGSKASSSDFYFYDITQKERGEAAFRKIWGDIQLTDDWRMNPVKKTGFVEKSTELRASTPPKFDPQTYIAKIPTDKKVIDSILDQRNFANYQLGIIYKDKFNKYDLAISKLKSLLENTPEERLILPSKYYLYKIYDELGDEVSATTWKNDIITNHPDSRYASILRNPEAYRSSAENPQNIYETLYKRYKSGEYEAVRNEIETYTKVFVGNSILPKLELLKARVVAKLEGVEAYTKALNYVALTYPQSQEGKYAQERYKDIKRKPMSSEFDFKPSPNTDYILVFDLNKTTSDIAEIQKFKNKLKDAVRNESGLDLRVNESVYNQNQTFLTISGLKSELGAKGLAEKFIKNAIFDKNFTYFVISEKNYKIAQIHKNLDEYLAKTK